MKIAGTIFIALGIFISFFNWMYLFISLKQKRHISQIPFLGGILLILGFWFFEITRKYALFAFILDYGTIVGLISIPTLIKASWRTSRFNLKEKYIGKSEIATYCLKLYKKNNFVLSFDFNPLQICNEYGAEINSFNSSGHWVKNEQSIILQCYMDERTTELIKTSNDEFISKETNYPTDKKYTYDKLDNIKFVKLV